MLREGGRFLRIELQGYSDCSGNKKNVYRRFCCTLHIQTIFRYSYNLKMQHNIQNGKT